MTDHLTHAAYHEAAHAVIGHVLGLPCIHATIVPDDECAGHVIGPDPMEAFGEMDRDCFEEALKGNLDTRCRDLGSLYRAKIIGLMAGAEAEKVIFGGCLGGDGGGDYKDRYQIALIADSDFAPDKWERYEPRMRRQTRRLVRKHRDKIERVARALLEHQTLSGEAIEATISSAMDG
jgi:hypothetical protein